MIKDLTLADQLRSYFQSHPGQYFEAREIAEALGITLVQANQAISNEVYRCRIERKYPVKTGARQKVQAYRWAGPPARFLGVA